MYNISKHMQKKKHSLVLTVQLCGNRLERGSGFFFLLGSLALFMAPCTWYI